MENKKNKSRKIIRISIISILSLFLVFVLLKIKSIYFNYRIKNTEEKIQNDKVSEKNEVLSQKLNDLIEKFFLKEDLLKNRIENLENNLLAMQNSIDSMQKNIIDLENKDPVNGEKNLQIVILLYKIKNVVHLGGDFSEYFNHLKILTKNKDVIFENILKLEKYKLQKTQLELKKMFFEEYANKVIPIDENNNIVKNFLKENIKIRKIANIDKNTDNTSLNIANIENSIDKLDYKASIDLILQNSYENNFSNTLNILYEKNEVLKIIEETLDFIYDIKRL